MGFYNFIIDEKKSSILAIFIVSMVLAICLFPIWPYLVKLAIFYISFYFLVFMFIFYVIRLIIYYLFRLCGYEFWILPELFMNVP